MFFLEKIWPKKNIPLPYIFAELQIELFAQKAGLFLTYML